MQLSFGARREALQSAEYEKQQWELLPWHRCWEQVLLPPHLSTLGDLINPHVPRGTLSFWAQPHLLCRHKEATRKRVFWV